MGQSAASPPEEGVVLGFIRRLGQDCSGPTAIEYSLIGFLVFVAMIYGLQTLGTTINAKYTFIATSVAS